MAGGGGGGFGQKLSAALDKVERSCAGAARAMDHSARGFEAIERAASRAQAAVDSLDFSKLSGGGSGGAASAKLDAGKAGGDIAGALAPLASIGSKITAQLDAVGGTVITLARRIDGAMKFSLTEKALAHLAETAESDFVRIGASAARTALKVRNYFATAGDVAGKGLGRVVRLGAGFQALPAPIAAATSAVKGLGIQIALGLGAFGLAYKTVQSGLHFLTSGVKGAVDLNETLSKTSAVFGPAGKAIGAEADVMAKKFGTVKNEFMEGSIGIAQMGLAAGKSAPEAVSLGNAMAKLAANFSSQDNIEFAEALDKIRSGLAGESEPLRRYGVLLSEDAVKAKALAMGAVLVAGNVDQQAKVMARAALIQEALSRTSGDLANTIDQPANAFRKFTGTLTNLATEVGTLFLPAIQKGIGLLNLFASSAMGGFASNKGAIKGLVDSIVHGLGTMEVVFKNWPTIMEMFWLKTHEVFTNFDAVLATIMPNFQIISRYVKENWYKAIWDSFNGLNLAVNHFLENLVKLGKAWVAFAAGDLSAFDEVKWTPLLDGFKATVDQFPDLMKPVFVSLDREIGKLWDGINKRQSEFIGGFLGDMMQAANNGIQAINAAAPARIAEPKGGEKGSNAAALFGSAEAQSAIARHAMGGDPAERQVKLLQEQLGVSRQIAAGIARFNAQVAADNPALYPI